MKKFLLSMVVALVVNSCNASAPQLRSRWSWPEVQKPDLPQSRASSGFTTRGLGGRQASALSPFAPARVARQTAQEARQAAQEVARQGEHAARQAAQEAAVLSTTATPATEGRQAPGFSYLGAGAHLPRGGGGQQVAQSWREWAGGWKTSAQNWAQQQQQNISQTYATCTTKFWDSRLGRWVTENPNAVRTGGFVLGGLAIGTLGYLTYRWYNQIERQLERAARAGDATETGKLLDLLITSINEEKDERKKQIKIGELKIILDVYQDIKSQKEIRTMDLQPVLDKIKEKVKTIADEYAKMVINGRIAEIDQIKYD